MTAIVIWLNEEVEENPSLWVAADSLITRPTQAPLIGDAAKLLPLQVICKKPDSKGFFSVISSAHSYGYAFAGSTLIGQNIYLSLQPLLGSLLAVDEYVPSMKDVANYIYSYISSVYEDVKVTQGPDAKFCIAFFGSCPVNQDLAIYTFQPAKDDSGLFRITCEVTRKMSSHQFVYLGDKREHMLEAISAEFLKEESPGSPRSRCPRAVIQAHIESDEFPTIGGDIQLGIADRHGFQPYLLCRPRVKGRPDAYISYLGRELSFHLSHVGHARVGLSGMV